MLAASLLTTGCSWFRSRSSAGLPNEVRGTVIYRQRIALPPGAELRVTLNETSRQDVKATFIAEQIIPDVKQVPIAFRIKLVPGVIDPNGVYTLTARISVGERLLYINDTQVRVLTLGQPSTVEIEVVPVERAPRS